MQGTLATLLLITSAVALASVVVDYAVVTVQQTVQPSNLPQMERIQNLESLLLNQTSTWFNETAGLPVDQISP
jgi:hypothetical protein